MKNINTLKLFISPSRHDPRQREKIYLSFYFQTSLWSLLKSLGQHKKKWKQKYKLVFILGKG